MDLHTHSLISDGTQRPAEVVAEAARAGLTGLALTDHDTTAGWSEARTAAEELGMMFVPGTEITTLTDDGISVHLLSYLHDPEHPGLQEAIATARDGRTDRARRMTARLARDFPVTWDDVAAQIAEGATVGRPHLADALVTRGVVGDRQEAFDRLLHKDSPYYVFQRNIGTTRAIRLVREAGGVPVIAHAMASSRGRTVSEDQLEAFAAAGLGGVEVYHRDNPDAGRERLRAFAARHDLLITGSSDYHGAGKPNIIGENSTDLDTVQALIDQSGTQPGVQPGSA